MKKKNRRSYPIVRILITVVLLCMLFGVNVVAASKTVTMKKVSKTYYTYSQVLKELCIISLCCLQTV